MKAAVAIEKSALRIFRFNMIEIALALVVLAIGLSSVLILFPIGANAGKSSVTDNNLANVAEQVVSYLQASLSTPANWTRSGDTAGSTLSEFAANPADGAVPTGESGFTDTNQPGLKKKDNSTYIYRQYTKTPDPANPSSNIELVDFEVMVRVGLDTSTMLDQYYPLLTTTGDKWKKLSEYSRNSVEPSGNNMGANASATLSKCYRTLIMEFSWPIEAPWANREKRIFRLEMFNENFVPYPQTNP